MKIINLSDLDQNWCWLRDEFLNTDDTWHHQSSQTVKLPKFLPKKDSLARAAASYKAIAMSKKEPSLLVSHGPRPTYYGANTAKWLNPSLTHLAFSFNFTDLPSGFQHKAMAKAYQSIDRFVVYTTIEKKMYADYFNIPPESIDILHWAVHAPKIDLSEPPIETGSYICAIGSQGRDYATLFSAIKPLKNIKLVLVASPESLQNLEVPDNVTIHTNIPLKHAHNILMHSKFMVLPLRDSQVPCGIVTIVSGMFFKKAVLVTNSEAVHDYIKDADTGLLCEAKDSKALSEKISMLWEDEAKCNAIAESGFSFAHQNCTEKSVVSYFENYLNNIRLT